MRHPKGFIQTVTTSLTVAVLLAGLAIFCSSLQTHAQTGDASNLQVERGRYLVQPAGQCADCHGNTLHGMSLAARFNPQLPAIVQRKTPKIAGLPMFRNDNDAIHFLQTGELPGGAHARPPMPQYRFSHDDASAIVAYLRSLH